MTQASWINWEKLNALAPTPRVVHPLLVDAIGNRTNTHFAGCSAVAIGVLALVVSAIVSIFWSAALIATAVAGGVVIVGAVLLLVSRGAGRRIALEVASTYPLALAQVVQANQTLYLPEGNIAGAVLVFAVDPVHALDAEWLNGVAMAVTEQRYSTHVDPAVARVGELLRQQTSLPDEALPGQITSGVAARIYATTIDTEALPGRCLPPQGAVLAILIDPEDHPIFVPPALWLS